MPVLHKYKDRDDYYILTSIRGNIITFQVTSEGKKKVVEAGIEPEQTFRRSLLLHLIQIGQVYTHGTGPGEIDPYYDPRQLQFDFIDDPQPDTMFPSCSVCSSLTDLHLVEIEADESQASLLCESCRKEKVNKIDTSVPIYLVTRSVLKRLLERKGILNIDKSVKRYQELLDSEFENKWEAIRKTKGKEKNQQLLFNNDDGDQTKLF